MTHEQSKTEGMRERFDDTFYEEVNSFMGVAFGDTKLDDKLKQFIEQEISLALAKEREDILKDIENLPAYTPLSDKTMSKVADDAKKPRWGSNYLDREKVINTIKQRV